MTRREAELLKKLRGMLKDAPDNAVRDLRRRSGLAQTAVALKSESSQAAITDVETGRRPLTWPMADKLAPALNVTPEDLMAADVLVSLKGMLTEHPDELDAQVLYELVRFLEPLLADTPSNDELIDTLLKLAMERLEQYKSERAQRVALKSADDPGDERPRRDSFGRRRDKPFKRRW